jgi:hypothetical protein
VRITLVRGPTCYQIGKRCRVVHLSVVRLQSFVGLRIVWVSLEATDELLGDSVHCAYSVPRFAETCVALPLKSLRRRVSETLELRSKRPFVCRAYAVAREKFGSNE